VLVAFVLFGFLSSIKQALTGGVQMAGADRLVVRHKVSIIQLLPESYKARMERIPGVVLATHQTWFGGIYQDPKNFFMQCPGGARGISGHFIRNYPAAGPEKGLECKPAPARLWGEKRRKNFIGKSATRFPFNPPSGRRPTAATPGNSILWAFSTARKRGRTRRRCFSATIILTKRARRQGPWSAGTPSGSRTPRKAAERCAAGGQGI
jgi:hypothetical protein